MKFSGKVASGIGYGTLATQLPWFTSTMRQRYGIEVIPGTFNLLQVSSAPALLTALLRTGTVLVPPDYRYCCALLHPVQLLFGPTSSPSHHDAILVRPLVASYPLGQVEFLSEVHLRTLLGVADGDPVTFQLRAPQQMGGWILAAHPPTESYTTQRERNVWSC